MDWRDEADFALRLDYLKHKYGSRCADFVLFWLREGDDLCYGDNATYAWIARRTPASAGVSNTDIENFARAKYGL